MGRGGVYGPGRIIIESCSTKIVLKQDQAASQVLKEAFDLGDGEEKFIVNARVGQGISVTKEGRIPSYNFLSDEERRLFTTRPKSLHEQKIGMFLSPRNRPRHLESVSLIWEEDTAIIRGAVVLACEWCGQPTTRTDPMLCAECYFKYWTKTRMREADVGKILTQRIAKLDCEACRLRTEHYVQSRDGVAVLCRCLKCGQVKRENLLSGPHEASYPEDDRRPLYVL